MVWWFCGLVVWWFGGLVVFEGGLVVEGGLPFSSTTRG